MIQPFKPSRSQRLFVIVSILLIPVAGAFAFVSLWAFFATIILSFAILIAVMAQSLIAITKAIRKDGISPTTKQQVTFQLVFEVLITLLFT